MSEKRLKFIELRSVMTAMDKWYISWKNVPDDEIWIDVMRVISRDKLNNSSEM